MTVGIVGAGQFGPLFAALFAAHPGVDAVGVTDLVPERARLLGERLPGAMVFPDHATMFATRAVDAVAVFTQRWTHGPLTLEALAAGKHVYASVPMASAADQIRAVVEAVRATGLVYMMGETAYYGASTVYARRRYSEGAFGQVFYAEGDYLHDMDLGFYDAYRYSGGAEWKRTASFPPLLYPTHAIGGVLGVVPTHAVSVSALGVRDRRGDGVFDRMISMFDNDISNATALFELADGGILRTNEMRRVGYPSHLRESRYRFFGTEASFEETATQSLWQDRAGAQDVTASVTTHESVAADDPSLTGLSAALRTAFVAGCAPVHDTARLPAQFEGLPNGHGGSHHFLVDDFVRAVTEGVLPPVNAWTAARFTLPGIVAHDSARQGGIRLPVDDLGDPPWPVAHW